MENKKKSLITYAIVSILLVFGVYSSTMNYAYAVSVANVVFATGSTSFGVAYRTGLGSSNTDSTAYIIGDNGGVAYVWKKSGSSQTIIQNVTLTGSVSARAIEFNPDIIAAYAVTNDKFYKLTTNLGISAQLASGTANIVRKLIYDDSQNTLYYCTNDGYGTVNQVTLSPTTLYSDPQLNPVLDCALDETNQFMYLSGSDMGASFTCEILKISLASNTEVDCVSSADNPHYGICYSSFDNSVWATASANSRVKKYDSDLNLSLNVAVNAIPRFCTIVNSDGANRLYVNIESNDSVTIIDTEANVILTSPTTCNQGTTVPHPDAKRLFNTTNVFITCPESTASVIIDDTVSEEIPEVDPDSCDNPANANILRCRLGEDDGLGGIGDEIGEGITDLGCNVIFVDCDEDSDPRTNGLGLLIFIASIFVVIGMFYYSIGTEAFHMPIFIWIIIIVALSAFFTIIGLIDPIFLVLSIVAVIALAVPKIIGIVRGGNSFGGGSSA